MIGTVPLLELCLTNCEVLVVRSEERDKTQKPSRHRSRPVLLKPHDVDVLQSALDADGTMLLYPGPGAVDIESLAPATSTGPAERTLIVVDGTWRQAGPYLHPPPPPHTH
jgi:hypothetical protein